MVLEMAPLPRLPLWLSLLLIGLGIASVALKAALFGVDAWIGEPDRWRERLADDLLAIAAGVLLAAGGINEFARGIQRKLQKRATATLVLELLNQASDRLVRMAGRAYEIAAPAFPPHLETWQTPESMDVHGAFSLGMPGHGSGQYGRLSEATDAASTYLAELPAGADARSRVLDRGRERASEICDDAATLRRLVDEVARYREDEARRLVEAAARLERSALDLQDHLTPRSEPDADERGGSDHAERAVREVLILFHNSRDLNAPLREAYRDVVLTIDPDLPDWLRGG